MAARSVVRPGLPGRIRNPYYSQPQTAPQAAQAPTPQELKQQAIDATVQQQASAGLRGSYGFNASTAQPQQTVKTQYGNVTLIFPNGTPTISQNQTFSIPFNTTQNGYTSSGQTQYTYAISGNQLVPTQTGQTGQISYNGTAIATISNSTILPLPGAKVTIPITESNQPGLTQGPNASGNLNLGTITEVPTVSNGKLGLQYSGFQGNTVQRTVTVDYFNPFTGRTMPVGYTYNSNPTTYNPSTGQVSLSFPQITSVFGESPLFIAPHNATINVGGTPETVSYNILVSPSSASTELLSFNVGGTAAKSIGITSSSGVTDYYSIQGNNIINTSSVQPVSISGVSTKAVIVGTYGTNGAPSYTILNPSATSDGVTGNIVLSNPEWGFPSFSSSTPASVLFVPSSSQSSAAVPPATANPFAWDTGPSQGSQTGSPLFQLQQQSSSKSYDMTTTKSSNVGIYLSSAPGSSVTTGTGLLSGSVLSALGVKPVYSVPSSSTAQPLPTTRASTILLSGGSQTHSSATNTLGMAIPTQGSQTGSPLFQLQQQSSSKSSYDVTKTVSSNINLYFAPVNPATTPTGVFEATNPNAFYYNPNLNIFENINAAGHAYIINPIQSAYAYVTAPVKAFGQSETAFISNSFAPGYTAVSNSTSNPYVEYTGIFALAALQSVLTTPAGIARIISNPVTTAQQSVNSAYSIATHPTELANPSVAGSIVGSIATFYALGRLASPDVETTADAEITPKSVVVAYKSTDTNMGALIGTKYTPTAIDMLDNVNAQETEFNPGLPASPGVVSTPGYQISFGGGRILYAVSSDAGYSGASLEIGTALYGGEREYFAATANDRFPVYTNTPGRGVVIQSIGKTYADITIPDGISKLYGIPVKNIQGVEIEFQGTTDAASGEGITQTAPGEAFYTTKLIVKNNPIARLFGNPTREVIVATGTSPVAPADITPLSSTEGFAGEALPRENGYSVIQGEPSISFYGKNPMETMLGTEFKGYLINEKGVVTPIIYYDTADLGNAAKALGIDTGEPDLQSPILRMAAGKQAAPESLPTVTVTPETADEAPSVTVVTQTSKPVIPTIPKTLSATVTVPTATTASDVLYSSIGIDPALIISQPSRQDSVRSSTLPSNIIGQILPSGAVTKQTGATTIYNSILERSIGIASSTDSIGSISLGRGATNSLSNTINKTTLKNANVLKNLTGTSLNAFTSTDLVLSTAQKTTQKTTQKTAQKTTPTPVYPGTGVPSITPPPGLSLPFVIAPNNRKPPKRKAPHHSAYRSIAFGYNPDVSSVLLGLKGNPKKSRIYKKAGFARPLL